jgi:hypothetical protein
MFDSKGLRPETIAELERLLAPGEKLLLAERVRHATTSRTGFIVITDRSLRPWIESTHRAAIRPTVLTPGVAADTPAPDLTMAEAG